jgi:hypothetical protein
MRHSGGRLAVAVAVAVVGGTALAQDAAPEGALPAASQPAGPEPVAAVRAEAAAADAELYKPLSVTLVPPVGTNWPDSGRVANTFALGLLGAHAGRVDGLAAAFGATWVERRLTGAQAALGFNVAGGDVQGLQVSLGANVGAARLHGLQASLGGNVAAGEATGAQASLGGNVAAAGVTGLQAAVGANVAAGRLRGLQASAGFNLATGEGSAGLQASAGVNVARELAGAQLSLLNVGGDVTGAQVGLVNVARRVTGVQLGLVNVAGEVHGTPIGLLSFAGNGMFRVQGWTSDVAVANVGLKFGGRHLYTLLTAGYQPGGADTRRVVHGLGFGAHLPLGAFWLEADVVGSSVRPSFFAFRETRNVLAQTRLVAGFQLAERFGVFAGATANAFVNFRGRDYAGLGSRYALTEENPGATVRYWPGFVAGVQI